MTINVAMVTYDSVVLGCDSLSSVVEPMIDPAAAAFALDAQGQEIVDAHGNRCIPFDLSQARPVTTQVFGGVSKMFPLYEHESTNVAAVTSGLAFLCGLPISDLAKKYRQKCRDEHSTFLTVSDVAKSFLGFVREFWEREVGWPNLSDLERSQVHSVEFLVGGFGQNDAYGRVFRTDVMQNSCTERFISGNHCGICWIGQSEYVERLMMGSDRKLQSRMSLTMRAILAEQRSYILQLVEAELGENHAATLDRLKLSVAEPAIDLPWSDAMAGIAIGVLPIQYAVDLVSFLVNTQSGMQHFASSIATVGGRTHVGYIQRGARFRPLNELDVSHRNVGYDHEL
jgi:hypothetical protein